ncbi:hypothetical protein QR680_018073 [Steinernema hermaphroditum]|uniref:C2HC/C3H-type domain-containing protein n=1 Tax=Steinernema hermaphroditum TaxID=289476 RepID=A0AA39LQ89_9BILA|nr:hypothetical protein QR680_018073 [Steinernema hermaphroditum]
MASELFNFRNIFTRQQRTAAKTATSTSSSSQSSKKSSGSTGQSQFWSNPRKDSSQKVKNPFGKEDHDQYNVAEETFPCATCGRRFIKSSLDKHEPACGRLSNLSRKKFDSGKQRADGSDVTLQGVRKAAKEREKMGGSFPRPKTSWREKHTNFISAVASSKQVEYALKSGAPLPPPPKTSVPSVYLNMGSDDGIRCYSSLSGALLPPSTSGEVAAASTPSYYVQCEYCGRNFNQNAAERHIPFCREQQMRNRRSTSHSRVSHTPASKPKTAQRSSSSTRPPLPPAGGQGAAPSNGGTGHNFRANRPPSRRSSNDRAETAKSRAGGQRSSLPTSSSRRSTSAPRTSQSPSRSQLKTPTPVRLKR